jgi:hypothetical protein
MERSPATTRHKNHPRRAATNRLHQAQQFLQELAESAEAEYSTGCLCVLCDFLYEF